MRYARKVDANHADIRDGLRKMGYEVLDLSVAGAGVPDLAVKIGFGHVHFLEIKDGAKVKSQQKLTPEQEAWNYYAHSITSKVNSLDEAINAICHAKEQKC